MELLQQNVWGNLFGHFLVSLNFHCAIYSIFDLHASIYAYV